MTFLRQNLLSGILDEDLEAIDTTITSSELASMITVSYPETMRVVLDPSGEYGIPEIVNVTAHSSNATTATISRAAEDAGGLPARKHVRGTRWAAADTVDTLNSLVVSDADDIKTGTFPVSRGGTGRSTLTSNSYLRGNGTSQVSLRTPAQVRSDIGAEEQGTASNLVSNLTSSNPVQIGLSGTASGTNSVSTGRQANSSGLRAVATGYLAEATAEDATAIGPYAKSNHKNSIALANTTTTAQDQLHVGNRHILTNDGRALVSNEVFKVRKLSQASFDALNPKDPATLYIVE